MFIIGSLRYPDLSAIIESDDTSVSAKPETSAMRELRPLPKPLFLLVLLFIMVTQNLH